MLEKDYYSVRELKNSGKLTDDDIRYFLERRELSLVFFRLDTDFVLGKWEGDYFTGYCYVFYSGLVEIDQFFDEEFINNKYVESTYCCLLERERMSIVESECPTLLTPPNQFFRHWDSKLETELNLESYSAMENPSKIKLEPHEKAPENGFAITLKDQKTRLHFFTTPHKYQLDDLKISHSDLIRLGVIENNTPKPKAGLSTKSGKESHDEQINLMKDNLHRVLARILIFKNNPSLEVVWRHLKNDFDTDKREFDSEEVLLDVTNSELVYKTHTEHRKTIQKSTVGQHISRVRKSLRLSKK